MALSKQAQELLDMILGKPARVRDPGSPPPGKKLMQTAKGGWELVPDVQRFQKSRAELSPAAIAFLQKMTHKSDKSEELLKECRASVMNSAEQRQVLEAIAPEMAKSIHARPHVLRVGRSGAMRSTPTALEMSKRAPQTPITDQEMQGQAPMQPAWGHPRSEAGLSDSDLRILENAQIANAGTMGPDAMQRLLEQVHTVITRNPKRGFPA
jgi:hypothetical protein